MTGKLSYKLSKYQGHTEESSSFSKPVRLWSICIGRGLEDPPNVVFHCRCLRMKAVKVMSCAGHVEERGGAKIQSDHWCRPFSPILLLSASKHPQLKHRVEGYKVFSINGTSDSGGP